MALDRVNRTNDARIVGTSPGGSRLIQYGGHEFEKPQIGFTEEEMFELVELREHVYAEVFLSVDGYCRDRIQR